LWSMAPDKAKPAGVTGGLKNPMLASDLLSLGGLFHNIADVDEVVGDDTETNPAIHSGSSPVAATVEAVSPFDDADAPLASGAPLLAVTEPALFLLAFAFNALGRSIGNADALDALCLRSSLVAGGIECSVRRDQARHLSQQGLMRVDGWDQQI
jgi:hypothetical protein